jgi:hypothetical protein
VDLYAVRRPFYQSVAEMVVDVDALTPDQVVDRVLDTTGLLPTGAG